MFRIRLGRVEAMGGRATESHQSFTFDRGKHTGDPIKPPPLSTYSHESLKEIASLGRNLNDPGA